jgi:hypothetical protein
MFDFNFAPSSFGFRIESSPDRVTSINPGGACFACHNNAVLSQTINVTAVASVITPILTPPFNRIHVETDSRARGRVNATALPGWARASVEAQVRVLNLSRQLLAESSPVEFGRSAVSIPVFGGVGFLFSGVAWADAVITGALSTQPLIVEVRITSWATTAGWATAESHVHEGCIERIHVFSA